MYSFLNLEPVCCSVSSSNCCFLTCIQISQEASEVVWYSHLLKNFPQFVVIHTVKGLLIADNTLWDGHVLEDSKDAQTVGIQKFNDKVYSDDRVERVIVPVRDGMTLIRKIKQ